MNNPTEIKENKLTPNLEPPEGSQAAHPEPSGLFENNPVNLATLRELEGESILEAGQFSFNQVAEICKLAAILEKIGLLKWKPSLAGAHRPGDPTLSLGILGTPGSMRAVKSFLLMSLLFRDHIGKVTVISEMADPFGADVIRHLVDANIEYEVSNDVREHLPTLDVIYMNSIAFLGDSYRTLDSRYKLDASSPLKKDAVILHPLARLDELDTSLDTTPHNLYFSQARKDTLLNHLLSLHILHHQYIADRSLATAS